MKRLQRSAVRRMRSEAGFTLIEIMVVVFILGLLVTMVAPQIMGRTDDARRVKAGTDIRAIEQALQLFKLDTGRYPSGGDGINALVGGSQVNPEGYLPKQPIDPWGNPYVYNSDGQGYVVKSYGADGSDGGDGKNADISSEDL
ncbi:MAG TPA: type II secretion system major pseudopilin GspG [Terriglobales bacterium]|nr:type II secretion system major pseudopilin GspG [Terriglobales bacterium]